MPRRGIDGLAVDFGFRGLSGRSSPNHAIWDLLAPRVKQSVAHSAFDVA